MTTNYHIEICWRGIPICNYLHRAGIYDDPCFLLPLVLNNCLCINQITVQRLQVRVCRSESSPLADSRFHQSLSCRLVRALPVNRLATTRLAPDCGACQAERGAARWLRSRPVQRSDGRAGFRPEAHHWQAAHRVTDGRGDGLSHLILADAANGLLLVLSAASGSTWSGGSAAPFLRSSAGVMAVAARGTGLQVDWPPAQCTHPSGPGGSSLLVPASGSL